MRKPNDPQYQVNLKQHELASVNKQIEQQKREIISLEKQVDAMSGAQRLGHMQNELKECQKVKQELESRIKQLTIEEKKHSQQISRYLKEEDRQQSNANGVTTSTKSTVLVNELRVWKEKVNKLQQQKERDEVARKNQEAATMSNQNENRQYIE